MGKLSLIIKKEEERILKYKLENAESVLLVNYSGISASGLSLLRNSLTGIGSGLMVIKNSLGKRIFKPHQEFCAQIAGPCGFIFVNKDLISAFKVIYKFAKDYPTLQIKAGFQNGRTLTQGEIETISKIPSVSFLQGKVVMGLKSPIFNLVFSLKHTLNKLVWVLSQIKDKHTANLK